MTQMEKARAGKTTPEMKRLADQENIEISFLQEGMASGRIVVLRNRNHRSAGPVGVGTGLRTKVNANVGTSTEQKDIAVEVEKAREAVKAGADTIMDLSTGGDLETVRKAIMSEVPVVIGTVPIYQTVVQCIRRKGGLDKMNEEDLFDTIEKQAEEGVDFFTVHCGVTKRSLERFRRQGRIMDIVSRGGSFLAAWMQANDRENPLYEKFDRLLSIAAKHDVVLSLGDGLRPGALADATDRAQIEELIVLGELTREAWKKGVSVMIEGPGHVPLDQIQANVKIEKQICQGAPFYVLGPLVTDVAPGYDHITSAIGGALAAASGADFLCYVTPGEHLRLPDKDDVREGVMASRIAAHAGDIAKGLPHAMEWDKAMSRARKSLDWEEQIRLAVDPRKARELHGAEGPKDESTCSMCGEYCAIKMMRENF
jgi:phosphomethylpyrimidine synthase